MVRHVGPEPARRAVLAAHPEVVTGTSVDVQVQAWVVGPGVGGDDEQAARVRDALDSALGSGIPAVVDAGGLEVLPERLAPHVVLTPHAGELSRLLKARGIDAERAEIEAAPARWAREAAALTGATILLKGHTTVVVGHGAGRAAADVVLAQRDAPAWLATAGAGDVLAGLLGALLAARAQDLGADPRLVAELAAAAALVAGTAAQDANPGGPVAAGEVARALPRTIAALLAGAPARRPPRRIHVHHAPRRVVSR
jgi:ADP-dependent NAD(P)H-hydrate dehydratase / NAD(P)H-hydrate epimerase